VVIVSQHIADPGNRAKLDPGLANLEGLRKATGRLRDDLQVAFGKLSLTRFAAARPRATAGSSPAQPSKSSYCQLTL